MNFRVDVDYSDYEAECTRSADGEEIFISNLNSSNRFLPLLRWKKRSAKEERRRNGKIRGICSIGCSLVFVKRPGFRGSSTRNRAIFILESHEKIVARRRLSLSLFFTHPPLSSLCSPCISRQKRKKGHFRSLSLFLSLSLSLFLTLLSSDRLPLFARSLSLFLSLTISLLRFPYTRTLSLVRARVLLL